MIMTNGTADTAPRYFHNATGCTEWSGKRDSELSALDLVAILEFCEEEAHRLGWNDSHYGRDQSLPDYFHPDFLGGLPHAYWNGSYEEGVEAQRLSKVTPGADE